MIVAKAPVAVIWLDPLGVSRQKVGRMTSPARAGSRLLAANPTAVARNALAKRRRLKRFEQITANAAIGSRG